MLHTCSYQHLYGWVCLYYICKGANRMCEEMEDAKRSGRKWQKHRQDFWAEPESGWPPATPTTTVQIRTRRGCDTNKNMLIGHPLKCSYRYTTGGRLFYFWKPTTTRNENLLSPEIFPPTNRMHGSIDVQEFFLLLIYPSPMHDPFACRL